MPRPGAIDAADAWAAAWNTTCALGRRRLLARACRPDLLYADAATRLHGLPALCSHIGRVRDAHPGSRWCPAGVTLQTPLLQLPWHWHRDGAPVLRGFTVLVLDGDGRITRAAARLHGALNAARLPALQPGPMP